MVKVIEEHPKPVAQVRCDNCDSLLEYGNADLHVRYDDSTTLTAMRLKSIMQKLTFKSGAIHQKRRSDYDNESNE